MGMRNERVHRMYKHSSTLKWPMQSNFEHKCLHIQSFVTINGRQAVIYQCVNYSFHSISALDGRLFATGRCTLHRSVANLNVSICNYWYWFKKFCTFCNSYCFNYYYHLFKPFALTHNGRGLNLLLWSGLIVTIEVIWFAYTIRSSDTTKLYLYSLLLLLPLSVLCAYFICTFNSVDSEAERRANCN